MLFRSYDSHEDKISLWDKFFEMKKQKKNITRKIDEFTKELYKKESKDFKEKNRLKYRIKELEKSRYSIVQQMKKLLERNQLKRFQPYYYRALYDNETLKIKKIIKSSEDNEYGFLMNSARLNFKQNHYLIFKKDTTKGEMEITKELMSQYKTSVKCKQKEPFEDFNLDEESDFKENEEKPVFYLTDKEGNITSFGFTPYLKIAYKKSVLDGIKTKKDIEKVGEESIDYVKSIFGFDNMKINDKSVAYKGKLSFTNAGCKRISKSTQKHILKHLMNPKISSFQLYLKQDEIGRASCRERVS